MRYIFRIIILGLVGLACASNAKAETFCEGKYNQKANSLKSFNAINPYSGGNFFHSYNNDLRATIAAYRAMKGLPRLANEAAPENYDFRYIHNNRRTAGTGQELSTYKRAHDGLKLMTQARPKMHAGQMSDAIIDLDLLSSRGPADDWWLRAEEFEVLERGRPPIYAAPKPEEFLTHLTRAQKHIARIASENEAMDWMQSALILSTERYPWRHNGKIPSKEMENLLRHIESRALESEDLNPWYALLAHHQFYGREIPAEILRRADAAKGKLVNCNLNKAEYAVLTAGPFDTSENGKPQKSFALAEAKFLTVKAATSGAGLDISYHYDVKALAEAANDKRQFALPLMLSAPSMNEVKEAIKLSPAVSRPLLLLPSRDLSQISPATAFTHYLSFDKTTEASLLLNEWLDEKAENRIALTDILRSGVSEKIQQTLVTLRMPCLSHFVSEFCRVANTRSHIHRNIGPDRRDGAFVRRELAEWLYPSFEAYRHHQRYFRQYDTESYWGERRAYERFRDRPPTNSKYRGQAAVLERGPVPDIFPSESFPVTQGLAALADPLKIAALAHDKNLVRALSLNIIDWVETSTDSEKASHASLMSEGLYRIIRENRHQGGGEIDGIPLQQEAYQLLHAHFETSVEAKKTPYWWTSRGPHG